MNSHDFQRCGCARAPTSGPRSGRAFGRARRPRHLNGLGAITAGLGITLLPKCPMCLAAYFWIFGSVGLVVASGYEWFLPLLVVSLVACAAATGLGGGARRDPGPFVARVIAVIAILAGRFGPGSAPLLHSGLALLVVAWLLDRRPVKAAPPDLSLLAESTAEVPR